MSKLHYAVEIYTDTGDPSHTPLSSAYDNPALGLKGGVFRWVSDRPQYDGSTFVPTYGPGEIDNLGTARSGSCTSVFYEGFFQKKGILTNPSNDMGDDIARCGATATLSEFEFVVTDNTLRIGTGAVVDIVAPSGGITGVTAEVSGSGYLIGDQLTVAGGVGGVIQVAQLYNGQPSLYSIVHPGTGYNTQILVQTIPISVNKMFWELLSTSGPGGNPIPLVGRKVRFILFVDDVFYSRWCGVITNNPFDEVDFHISAGPDLTVHKTMPPNIVTTVTLPASGIGSQQTSQVTISGAVSPQSNIPANATVQSDVLPACFGDIPFAELVNVEGIPLMEKIAILGRGLIVPPGMSNLFNISCAVNSWENQLDGSVFTGPFNPSTSFITDTDGPGFTIYDYGYAMVLVLEDLQNTAGYWTGFGGTPFPMYPKPAASSFNSGKVHHFQDYFIFRKGDAKGIRIVDSITSYSSYLVTANPNRYRYLFVTVLILAETPEDFDISNGSSSNILIAPGSGFTPTDYIPVYAQNLHSLTPSTTSADKTSFFQVCKSIIKQVVSNFPIIGFTPALLNGVVPAYTANAKALPVLRTFSSDYKIYENANNLIKNAVPIPASNDDVQFPYLQLAANADVQQNGISLLNPIIIPPSAIKKIEWTQLGTPVSNGDPYLDEDVAGLRIARSILYGTPPGGSVIPPYVADSTKTGQAIYNIFDFNNLVDRDRTTKFPDIILSQQSRTPTPSGGLSNDPGNDMYGAMGIIIDSVDINGSITSLHIDPGYSKPSGYLPYDILFVAENKAFPNSSPGGMIQILTVDSSGTPLTITDGIAAPIYRPGVGYQTVVPTYAQIQYLFQGETGPATADGKGYIVTFSIDISSLIDTDIDKAFFGLDFIAKSIDHSPTHPRQALSFGLGFRLQDQYGRDIYLGDIVANGTCNCKVQALLDPTGNWIASSTIDQDANPQTGSSLYNLLPKDYYDGGGNYNGETDRFFLSSYVPAIGSGNAFSEIDLKTVLDLIKNRIAQPTLLVDFAIFGNRNKSKGSGLTVKVSTVNSQGGIGDYVIHVQGDGYYVGDIILLDGGIGGTIKINSLIVGGNGPGIPNYLGTSRVSSGEGYSVSGNAINTTVLSGSSLISQYVDVLLQIKQIGFVTEKVVNTQNKALFTEVQGEAVGKPWNPTSALPSSPYTGDVYYATAFGNGWIWGQYYTWNGSSWNGVTGTPLDPSGGLPGSPTIGPQYYATTTANGWVMGNVYTWNGAAYVIVPLNNPAPLKTNTIHTAIRHILEDYDNIPAALIDYGNLAATRGLGAAAPWYVGRQLQDQKNSIDYLIELCHQGFLGYFLSRTGKHSFSSWQDNTTETIPGSGSLVTHDESIVLRGSIQGLIKTDLSDVYCDFNLLYSNNPGLNKLDRSIIITHIDDREPGVTVAAAPAHNPGDGFPVIGCIDLDGVPLWTKYCSWTGVPIYKGTFDPTAALPQYPAFNDTYLATATANSWTSGNYYTWNGTTWDASIYQTTYTAASGLWTICHNSWLQSFTIQQTSGDLSQLNWFVDRTLLSDPSANTVGIGMNSTAWLLLDKLINYITKQKDTIPYSLPINSSTVLLDLLMPINVSDYIFTNDVPRLGWIKKFSTDVLNGKFDLELILQ